MVEDIVKVGAAAGALAAVIGLGYLIHRVFRSINGLWRKVSDFLDDWNGEPPRRGYPGRLSVMERLGRIEHCLGLSATHDTSITQFHVAGAYGGAATGTVVATTTAMAPSAQTGQPTPPTQPSETAASDGI